MYSNADENTNNSFPVSGRKCFERLIVVCFTFQYSFICFNVTQITNNNYENIKNLFLFTFLMHIIFFKREIYIKKIRTY